MAAILRPTIRAISFATLAVLIMLALAGCVREIERPENIAISTPTQAPATPTPTYTPLPTITPTSSPTPTPAATAMPTNTPSPSPTLSPTSTNTPAPTATRTPSPTPPPGLALVVLGPANGSTVLHDSVVVYGITSIGASVKVNEVDAVVTAEGRFQAEIALVQGSNTIEVIASDGMGGQKSAILEIVSLALPPLPLFLIVTEPQDQSIVSQNPVRLSGRTSPNAIVSVKGISVNVDQLGIFSTNVTLEQGPNIIDVLATDSTGEVQSAVLAIIYRP